MKKIFLVFVAIFLLTGCVQSVQQQNLASKNVTSDNKLKLGFCPTMKKDVLILQEKNQNLELVSFDSASEVLQNLKAEEIDLALIGRKAKSLEIESKFLEKNLETTEKYTLILGQKQMITESDLPNLQVKTCLNENVKNQFPELNLIFETNCDYLNGEAWLISWFEFTDKMELLIPLNEKGEKVRKFRNAFLYAEELGIINGV